MEKNYTEKMKIKLVSKKRFKSLFNHKIQRGVLGKKE